MTLLHRDKWFLCCIAMTIGVVNDAIPTFGQRVELLLESRVQVADLFGPVEIHPYEEISCPICAEYRVLVEKGALSPFGGVELSRLSQTELEQLESTLRANTVSQLLSKRSGQLRDPFNSTQQQDIVSNKYAALRDSLSEKQNAALDLVRLHRLRLEKRIEEERQQQLAEESRRRFEAERQARESRRQRANELFAKLDGVNGPSAFITRAGNSIGVIFNNSPEESTVQDTRVKIGANAIILVDETIEHELDPLLSELSTISDVRRVDSSGGITPLARVRNSAGDYRHINGTDLAWLKAVSELSALTDGSPIVFTTDAQQGIRISDSVVIAEVPSSGLQEQVRRVSAMLAECNTEERKQIWEVARTWSTFDLARLQKAIHVLKAPILFASEVSGVLTLRLGSGPDLVDYRDLNEDFPIEWRKSITNGFCIVDVSGVESPTLKADLCQRLRDVEVVSGNAIHWLLATRPDSRKRLAAMHGSGSFEFMTDDSIAMIANQGETCLAALRKVEKDTRNQPGARVRILSGHEGIGTQTVAKWIEEAKRRDSSFAGIHLVVVACNVRPEQMYEFVDVAIENGALSVSVPYETVSLHALTLASQRISKVAPRTDAAPLDYWRECYEDAWLAIEKSRNAANPLETLRIEFGEASQLFEEPSGTLNQSYLDEIQKKLRNEPNRFGPSFGIHVCHRRLVNA